MEKKDLVGFFISKGILVTPDIVDSIDLSELDSVYTQIKENISSGDFLMLNKDIHQLLKAKQKIDANWTELDRSKTYQEKTLDSSRYDKFLEVLTQEDVKAEKPIAPPENQAVKVKSSYDTLQTKKRVFQDFVGYYQARFNAIESLLSKRSELINLMSVQRVKMKKERDTVSIIGIVTDKQYTKNKNLMLEIEDMTGSLKVLVNLNRKDLFEQAKDIVLDEVIGIVGNNGDNILFSNSIIWPDVPLTKEIKKSSDEAYAIFLSDIHVGSNTFLEKEFSKFLKWLNGEVGNEAQQRIASLTKYIFIIGDLVDGVGVYPGQEEELVIKDIYNQYASVAEFLSRIPKDKHIIVCPGNHDAMRIAEPQLVIYEDIAKPLFELPNITLVSNPALVNIHSSEDFPGFDVLLYHGYSFDYFAREVESIRNNGGYDRADLIMKFLLKRRHLAPTHGSTLFSPDPDNDSLFIGNVPDFFVTGHIHKCAVASYRNVNLVCGSCWQSKTSFQEKVGHNPEPCRVPIVNLMTREMKIMKFGE